VAAKCSNCYGRKFVFVLFFKVTISTESPHPHALVPSQGGLTDHMVAPGAYSPGGPGSEYNLGTMRSTDTINK
jgi:hypothetical protein